MKKPLSSNANIKVCEDRVIKILRKTSKEKIARFEKECKILQLLNHEGVENIVEIYDVNISANTRSFSMKKYDGDSNQLLDHTKGNVDITANLILPLVRTLKQLSERPEPVFHRDIKPENILFEKHDDQIKLILADFGCAFLQDDNSDRITGDFRSVGARAFLAPEYHHGRVDEIDEKGDIFSIGKVIWYYINGIEKDVFPYTLWFPDIYNLEKRFPSVVGITKINLIVASCTHHDPNRRLNYDSLITELESILRKTEIMPDEKRKLAILSFEQRELIEDEEKRTFVVSLLNLFLEDIRLSFSLLEEAYGPSDLIRRIENSELFLIVRTAVIEAIVVQSTSYPLWQFSDKNLSITSAIAPASFITTSGYDGPVVTLPFIDIRIQSFNTKREPLDRYIRWIFDEHTSIKQWSPGHIFEHDSNHLASELMLAIDHIPT